MWGFRPEDLLVIFMVAFLLFGAKRLPEIGHSLGRALQHCKKAMSQGETHEEKKQQQNSRQETRNEQWIHVDARARAFLDRAGMRLSGYPGLCGHQEPYHSTGCEDAACSARIGCCYDDPLCLGD
jgi:sec-independent protein translocase protein TatA